jgi:hypothetical protein
MEKIKGTNEKRLRGWMKRIYGDGLGMDEGEKIDKERAREKRG